MKWITSPHPVISQCGKHQPARDQQFLQKSNVSEAKEQQSLMISLMEVSLWWLIHIRRWSVVQKWSKGGKAVNRPTAGKCTTPLYLKSWVCITLSHNGQAAFCCTYLSYRFFITTLTCMLWVFNIEVIKVQFPIFHQTKFLWSHQTYGFFHDTACEYLYRLQICRLGYIYEVKTVVNHFDIVLLYLAAVVTNSPHIELTGTPAELGLMTNESFHWMKPTFLFWMCPWWAYGGLASQSLISQWQVVCNAYFKWHSDEILFYLSVTFVTSHCQNRNPFETTKLKVKSTVFFLWKAQGATAESGWWDEGCVQNQNKQNSHLHNKSWCRSDLLHNFVGFF